MKKLKHSLLALCVSLTSAGLSAEEWVPVGAKGVGMSGAQVAHPEGSQAIWANPAALAKDARFDIALPISVTVGASGSLVENAEELMDEYEAGIDDAIDDLGTAGNFKKVSDFLEDAAILDKPGQGIRAQIQGGITARWGRFGISVGTRTFAGGTVQYDSDYSFGSTGTTSYLTQGEVDQIKSNVGNTAGYGTQINTVKDIELTDGSTVGASIGSEVSDENLAFYIAEVTGGNSAQALTPAQAEIIGSLAVEVAQVSRGDKAPSTGSDDIQLDNDSGVEVRALMTQEVALAYGFSFLDNKLHVAPTLKFVQGETRSSIARLMDEDADIGDELKEKNNLKKASTFSVDLGVLYQPHQKWSIGLVARDLNSPTFEMKNGLRDIELKPAVRGGVAYEFSQKPGWRGVVEVDADLVENESVVVIGSESQQIAAGVSQELMGFLSLRGGVAKDLSAEEGNGMSYSAGIGVQAYRFYLDLAGIISSEKVTVDGDDFPTHGGFGLTLGWNNNF